MAKTKGLNGWEIETTILENDSAQPVGRVKLGCSYGHMIEVSKFFRLYPTPVKIQSGLPDTRQLAFRETESATTESSTWEWEFTLTPLNTPGKMTKLLVCAAAKKRGIDQIVVKIRGDRDNEDLPLGVRIG